MPQTNLHNNFKHTDDINDIIVAPPKWIVSWGNSLLFLVVIVALILSTVIRYPTVIKTSVEIKTSTAPIIIAAKKNGNLKLILIADSQLVTTGKILGYFSSGDAENIPLIASQPGKVMISPVLQIGSPLASGQPVFFIKPEKEQLYGQFEIAENQLANIKTGQQVIVKPSDNSDSNYSVIRGRINYIAGIPNPNGRYIGRIIFNLDHSRTNNKPGQLKNGVKAEADILTEQASVLQRIFSKLTNSITQR